MLSLLKLRHRCCILIVVGLLAFFYFVNHNDWALFTYFFEPTQIVVVTAVTQSPRRGTTLPRLIVDWTTFFHTPIENIGQKSISECPIKCIFSSNKSLASSADAVMFHSRDIRLNRIPAIRHPFQRYVFFAMESPLYSEKEVKMKQVPANFFNMTMTIRLDSDIVASYDWMISKRAVKLNNYSPVAYSWDHVLSVVSKKTKIVAELVSNCHTDSKREKYVAELSQFLPVDSYGSCSGVKCENCEEMLTNDYMFYLAFENSVCRDYVTEKFWRIKKLVVPIVLRKSDYVNIVPPGSFIAIDQFKSSKDLAEYLQYLSSNRTEYLEYFEWTKHYWSSIELDRHFCELCKVMYNDSLAPKVYENIDKWWMEGGSCQSNYAERLLTVHDISHPWKLYLLLSICAVVVFVISWRKKRILLILEQLYTLNMSHRK